MIKIMKDEIKKTAFFDFLTQYKYESVQDYLKDKILFKDYVLVNNYILPMHYGDSDFEYYSLCKAYAIFDLGLTNIYKVTGTGSAIFMDYSLTRSSKKIPKMRALFTSICDTSGMLIDDAIVYKMSEYEYLLMPSFNQDSYFKSIIDSLNIKDIKLDNIQGKLSGLSVQGPLSTKILTMLGIVGVDKMNPFDILTHNLNGYDIIVSRIGFTTEIGYEVFMDAEVSAKFSKLFIKSVDACGLNLSPYGLKVVETCRIEAGLIIPGRDCSSGIKSKVNMERSPFELNLGWSVEFDCRRFSGRDALERHAAGETTYVLKSLICKTVKDPIPVGSKIYTEIDGLESEIGSVTSSSWSARLKGAISHVSVDKKFSSVIDGHVYYGGTTHAVSVASPPLINRSAKYRVS